MLATLTSRLFGNHLGTYVDDPRESLAASASNALLSALPELKMPRLELSKDHESTLLNTVGWVTAGFGAVAVGLFVGRELRQRYKFNRRTPYDFYAHSGDEMQDLEFGVGI